MADKDLTIRISVVVQGKEEHVAGLHILPPILEAEGVELDVDVPRGIPSQLIAHDIREWLDPMLKAWLWDYLHARSLPGQELPKPDPYVPKFNNPRGTAEGEG